MTDSQRHIFHERDGGFSTLGMVVALLVTLALIFSSAQVYRVMSAAADVQDVADAAALAAENEVAEFMIAVRLCDAVSLSLSLTGLISMGLGVAALCTPITALVSDNLLGLSQRILRARTDFAQRAAKGLNELQKALPFICAAQAAALCADNSGGAMHARYVGVAILVDSQGKEISVPSLDDAWKLMDEINHDAADIRREGVAAEEAAIEALAAKERAFASDCGRDPAYCMSERARNLAGLSGTQNPVYHSVDTWTFSVALKRAQSYYASRARTESTTSSSVKEQANSALRKRFYAYASQVLSQGYVNETDDSFQAYFPLLPKNNSQLRSTVLYTESRYPITDNGDGTYTMHAFSGCPNAAGCVGHGSIADMESGPFTTCPLCDFQMQSMGHIAAATSSTQTGFEYHYRVVAEQAELYEKAKEKQQPHASKVKGLAGKLLDSCKELGRMIASSRIDATPPGAYGAIALVVDVQSAAPSTGFENSFVSSEGSLGSCAAVSGATLIEEKSSEGKTIINSLLDGIAGKGGIFGGIIGIALDAWSDLLHVYSAGHEAISAGIERVLNSIPFASASGLGSWASKKFKQAIEDLGLQPAKTDALKPVIAGTGSIAEKGSEAFSARFLAVKKAALSVPMSSTSLLSSLITDVEEDAIMALKNHASSIEIATIQPLGSWGPSIPITISLPRSVIAAGTSIVGEAAQSLRNLVGNVFGRRVWE